MIDKNVLRQRFAQALKAGLVIIFLLPLFFTILVSFRPEAEPVTNGNIFFGSEITLDNYERALVIAPLVILFLLFQRQFVESFARSGIR